MPIQILLHRLALTSAFFACLFVVACLFMVACPLAIAQADLPPVETVDAATRTRWLVDGTVVDSVTGQPVKSFTVTPGTLSIDESGKTAIRWRDNLKRDMKDGAFQWPRTSGFSVMRFRVTAEGYHPIVTQQVNRGGPHIRIRVRVKLLD